MSKPIIRQVAGQDTYYDTAGTPLSTSLQPNVNSGAAMNAGASNDLLDNVLHGGSEVTGHEIQDSSHVDSADGGAFLVTEESPGTVMSIMMGITKSGSVEPHERVLDTGYVDGVEVAIRNGHWNPYTGSFSTAPTGLTFVPDEQDITTYVNFAPGAMITGDYDN